MVAGGVATLIVAAPLPMGSVHSWAFKPLEVAIFLLSAAWMVKLWRGNESLPPIRGLGTILVAGGAFMLLILLQLCPLPPQLLRIASPSTYALYARTLPGWPNEAPYAGLILTAKVSAARAAAVDTPVFLPGADEARNGGASVPFTPKTNVVSPAPPSKTTAGLGSRVQLPPAHIRDEIWRALSLAPALSYPASLKALAYSALFLVVLCYPFGKAEEKAEKEFYCTLLSAILLAGTLVAAIGLAERVEWNGRILWFFVPSDWGAPMVSALPRMSGPFVNPDHFANYLSMVLPLALATGLFPTMLAPAREPGPLRIVSLAAALLIFSAIVLSLSRGGWMGATLGLLVLFALSPGTSGHGHRGQGCAARDAAVYDRRLSKLFSGTVWRSLPAISVLGLGALLLLSLALVGPEGRDQTGARLQQTVLGGGNLRFRVAAWKDSLRMARDFPLFGVGFGAWPELFPRYRGAPWSYLFMRAAHNDYVQLLAETGLVGFCAAGVFFFAAGKRILSGFAGLDQAKAFILAAAVGGLAAAGVHAFFDFSLQIPANAVLFTVLVALALRMTSQRRSEIAVSWRRPFSACCCMAFLGLAGAAAAQRAIAYQYDAPVTKTVAQACRFVLEHPASSSGHLALALMLSDSKQSGRELERAIWLAPTDPHPRDIYAQYLAREGLSRAAAKQITLSVFNSPEWGTHFYLNPALLPWLSPDERQAIESGFKRAIADNFGGAVEGLGRFYDTLGRFSDEGDLYAGAAPRKKNPVTRATYLVEAGEAYVRAGDRQRAEKLFISAEHDDPAAPRAYDDLLNLVYGPKGELVLAHATVERGIANGVDPAELYSSLAIAAERAGDPALAQDAMAKVVRYAPTFDNMMRLGAWYMQAGKLDLAVATLERAVQLNPASADAYYLLAVARERSYDYPAADKDYARAIKLDPRNLLFRRDYDAFRQRIGYAGAPR